MYEGDPPAPHKQWRWLRTLSIWTLLWGAQPFFPKNLLISEDPCSSPNNAGPWWHSTADTHGCHLPGTWDRLHSRFPFVSFVMHSESSHVCSFYTGNRTLLFFNSWSAWCISEEWLPKASGRRFPPSSGLGLRPWCNRLLFWQQVTAATGGARALPFQPLLKAPFVKLVPTF